MLIMKIKDFTVTVLLLVSGLSTITMNNMMPSLSVIVVEAATIASSVLIPLSLVTGL